MKVRYLLPLVLLVLFISPPSALACSTASVQTVTSLVPFYVYPNGTWNTLITDHQTYPNVPIIAIINQNSGLVNATKYCTACQGKDPNYATYIPLLVDNGIRVIAYVNTQDGLISTADVEGNITAYYNYYPSISGIFFDNMANSGSSGTPAYYTTLMNFVHSKGSNQLAVGNPGTTTTLAYVGSMDVINSFENSGSGTVPTPSVSTVYTNTLGTGGVRTQWSMLTHDQSVMFSLSYMQSIQPDLAYMYATDKTEASNPWSQLASYYLSELSLLNQIDTTANVCAQVTITSTNENANPLTIVTNVQNGVALTSTNLVLMGIVMISSTMMGTGIYAAYKRAKEI